MSTMDASFGSNAQNFALMSADSRLYMCDVANKTQRKVYVDRNHLSHTFTCYCWYDAASPALFVVGFSDGTIVSWDLSRGVVARTIGKAGESVTPTDIVFGRDGKSIYVGSNENRIVQYDIHTGEVLKSMKSGKKGVLRMAMNPKVDVLAICSSSIKILDIASGRKRKLAASFAGGVRVAQFTPCGRFLVASSSRSRELLVFDTRAATSSSSSNRGMSNNSGDGADDNGAGTSGSNKKKKRRSSSSSHPDGRDDKDKDAHAEEAEEEDDADAANTSPAFVLPVKGLVAGLNTSLISKNVIAIMALFEDQGGCVFEISVDYANNVAEGVNSVLSETLLTASNPVIAGCFCDSTGNTGTTSSGDIMLAVGTKSNPVFAKLNLSTAATVVHPSSHNGNIISSSGASIQKEVVLNDAILANGSSKSISSGISSIEEQQQQQQQHTMLMLPPDVLGPHEMGGKKRPLLHGEDSRNMDGGGDDEENHPDAAKRTKKRSDVMDNSTGTGTTSSSSSSSGSGSAAAATWMIHASGNHLAEPSLEQRLEALSSSLTQLQAATTTTTSTTTSSNIAATGAEGEGAAIVPTSDSLVTLIDQALQSGDDSLLEQCLACVESDTIEASAARLPTGRVVLFLRKLVAKFEKRPSRGYLLTQWLSALLRYHTSFLTTIPDLSYQLAGLSQMLEQRLASYAKLASLSGRLDLLMSQVNYRLNTSSSNSITKSDSSSNAVYENGSGANGEEADLQPAQVYMEE